MAVLTTGHTFVDGQQVTSTRLNNSVNAATFASAAVDGTTTQLSSGAIIVKDLGISTGKIAASAVTTAKLATDSVSTAKIIDSNVTKAKIEDFTNLTVLGNVSGSAATPAEVTIIDDDTMGTASATTLATSESVKAYVDTQIGANNELSEVLANGNTTGANDIIVTAGQAITTDTVSETTAAAGVTVDSLLIKDGGITAAGTSTFAGQTISDLGTVTTANIDGGSIDGTTVGASSASTGAFTTLTASDDVNFDSGTLFVDASADRVGIGTTSPSTKLNVVSSTNAGIAVNDGTVNTILYNTSSANGSVGTTTNHPLAFYANNGEKMRLLANGNLGIGTSSPGHTLDVSGEFRVNGGGTGSIVVNDEDSSLCPTMTFLRNGGGTTTNDFIKFENSGGEVAAINSSGGGYFSGNVGIGTTSPATALDVTGTVTADGLTVDDGGSTSVVLSTNAVTFNRDAGASFIDQIGTGHISLRTTSSYATRLKINNNGDISFYEDTGSTVKLLWDASYESLDIGSGLSEAIKNFGTNTKLGVAGSIILEPGSGNEVDIFNYRTTNLNLGTGGSADLTIDSSGNVGIGRTPTNTQGGLDAAGAVLARGGVASNQTSAGGLDFNAGEHLRIRSWGATSGTGYMSFRTGGGGGSVDAEAMRITSDGDVGIGTTSPDGKCHIYSGSSGQGTPNSFTDLVVEDSGNSGINILTPSANYGQIAFGDEGDDNAGIIWYDHSSDDMFFRTGGSGTDVTIDSSGNVGIGTSSPAAALEVAQSGTDVSIISRNTNNNASVATSSSLKLGITSTVGTHDSEIKVVENGVNTNTTRMDFHNHFGGTLYKNMTILGNGDISFYEDTGTTAKFFWDASAESLGIGTTSPSYNLDVNGTLRTTDDIYNNISGTQSALPGYYKGTYGAQIESTATGSTLHIARSIGNCMNMGADATAAGTDVTVAYFRDTGAGTTVATEVGKIVINTSSTNFSTSSDYRLKENEVSITDGIDRLKQLSPYRFNFKVTPNKTVDGFFAHEVSDIVPEAITGTKDGMKDEEYEVSPAVYEDVVHPAVEATYDEDGQEITPAQEEWTESVLVTEAVRDTRSVPDYQGIDQSKLVPLLTAALQEAVAKIEALEARVQTLEG